MFIAFYSSSRPAPPPGDGTDRGKVGSIGRFFSYQNCNVAGGQNGQGGRAGGRVNSDSSEPTLPQACPGAKSFKRSVSDVSLDVRIAKREQEEFISNNSVQGAVNNFGYQTSAAIDSTQDVTTNKLPQNVQNVFVSGLKGRRRRYLEFALTIMLRLSTQAS